MRKILSLLTAFLFAASMMAGDPVEIASSTFNGSAGTHAEGWSTTGTGVGRSDCVIIGADENITSPEVDLSNYESITVQINSRRYGSLSGKKADIAVTFDGEAIGTVSATGTSATTALDPIEYTVNNLSTGNFVFTCTNATSAGSTHGAGINSIVITGIEKSGEGGGDTDPDPDTKTIYLNGGGSSLWNQADPEFFVHSWGGAADGDVHMTLVEGDVYKADIPADNTDLLFLRLATGTTEIVWSGEAHWNQSANQTIPEGKDLFTMTSWDNGTWSVYGEGGDDPVVPTYYVKGTFNNWGDGMEMTEGTYTFEDLAADTYEIKVVDDANNWYGFEVLDQTKSSANIYNAGGNIKFTLAEAGNVTVAYANSKITVTGTFVAPSTKFTVTVPEGTEKTYIAGNFNNWTPAEMTLKAGEEDVFELMVEGVESDTVAYKYLAGADWKFVEVIENNRSYNAADEVSAWKAVPTIYKYAKVKEAPVNWTGHYIIAWADHKPHSAIKVGSSSKDDFVAADDALVFTDGDTISIMEGLDFAVNIRFGASEGAYTLQLPDGKYIYLPNTNGVCSKDEATDMYLAVSPSTTQTGIQIGDKADMSNRVIYNNNTSYRSYTNKYETTGYILPTLYRLVDEAFDCQDGPYGVLINGKDVVVAEALAGEEEYDAAGRKQYRAYLNLGKEDIIQIVNTSCGSAWLPAIEEGGMSAHFDADNEMAVIDTTGCFDLYIKMKEGDDKLYIGAGICADDTIRYTVRGKGGILGEDFEKAIDSKQDTLELALEAGKYELKVVVGEDWKGFEQLTDTAAGLTVGDQGNICFTLKEDGNVTIVYNNSVFKLIGNFYVKPVVKKDLQLVPGVWSEAGAKMAAWIWGAELESQWTAFFAPKAAENDTLQVEINADADSIIFVRFKPEATEPTWDGGEGYIWNRLADDSIQYESLIYTITGWGEGQGEGTWDVYVPEVPAKYYITGIGGWAEKQVKSEADVYVFEGLKADTVYTFKVLPEGLWEGGTILGYDELSEKPAGVYADNNKNVCFKLAEAGDVTITYKAAAEEEPMVFTVEGNFYVKPVVKKDLQLVPGVWSEAGAKMAAWIWGAELESQWTSFFAPKSENNDTLKAEINADADSIIFVRFKPEATEPTWDGGEGYIWNRLANDSIQYESLIYTITGWGEGQGEGTWDVYVPEVPAKYYITGDAALVGEDLAWNPAAIASMEDEYEMTLAAGAYKMKITVDGKWETAKGVEQLTTRAAGVQNLNGNIGFILAEETTVKVTYTGEVFTLEGNFVQTPIIKTYMATGAGWTGDDESSAVYDAENQVVTINLVQSKQAQWQAQVWYQGPEVKADKYYDVSFKMQSNHAVNGVIAKYQESNEMFFDNTIALEENVELTYSKTNLEGKVGNNVLAFDFGFAPAGTVITISEIAIVEKDAPEYTLTDGYYLIGRGGWDISALTPDLKLTLNPDAEGGVEEYTIEANLVAGDEFQIVKVENDAIGPWFPGGEVNNYLVDADHAGAKTIYFRPNYNGGDDWHHNCIFVPANEPIVYCELPSGHLGQADFGDPSGRILLTIAKGEGNNLVVKIKNNNEAGNPQTGLNFLWVNATGATNNNATYGSHEAENVEEVSVIVEFDEAKETYHFNNIHWAYAGWTGEWAIDGLDVAASELCEEEEPIEYRLENGFYLISEAENWDVANVTAAMKFEANPDNEAEFVLTATFAEGDKIKVVKVVNDAIAQWYPDGEGTEYTVDAAHAGEKDIYFQEAYKADWSEFGGYFWMGANPIEYRLENGFYLISEAENWDVANVTAAMKFEANPDNEAEFVLTATFAEGDKIKVVKVENDAIAQWYPDGEGTEYTVDANHAGANKDIYFQEEYKADWATFGGYFWIGANDASAILNAEVENVAVKLLQNGQVIIRRGERVYTIMGQLIK